MKKTCKLVLLYTCKHFNCSKLPWLGRLATSLSRLDLVEGASVANVRLDRIPMHVLAMLSQLRVLGECFAAILTPFTTDLNEVKVKEIVAIN